MKYSVKFFVITFFVFFYTNTFAEEKIVIMDLKYVLNQSKAGKGAQDFLKKSFQSDQKKFSDLEKSLKKEEKDLLTKKSILSKEEYTKKSNELRKKVMAYQSKRRASLDRIASLRLESKEKLLNAINPILTTYIKENAITLVIDKKNTLGGDPDNDITKIIVDKLNKNLPSLNLK